MCILSPYLVEVGRHQNIEMITYADLKEVKGQPGNFKVKIRKKARSIHVDRCTGCRACIEACPVLQQVEKMIT
jgi:heterodisulfide reductase subunit A